MVDEVSLLKGLRAWYKSLQIMHVLDRRLFQPN